jgi:hypothetical protein
MRNVTLSLLAILGFTACGEGEKRDPAQTIEWDPECVGTLDTNACVTLVVGSNNFVRTNAVGDLIGTVYWALYNEGDVDLLTGPKTGVTPAYSGEVEDVNVSTADNNHMIHVANISARKYHALLQLDDDLTGAPNDGDVVTLPQAAFTAAAGEHTTRDITFNHLCGEFAAGECDP